MSKIQYRFKYDEYGNTREVAVYSSGAGVNSISFVNKGTAFNRKERTLFGLEASLPPGIREIEDQIANTRRIVEGKADDIDRYVFIRALYDRNVTLAHALIRSNFERYIGIVYTPTISEAVTKYSSLYRQANGVHLNPGNIEMAEDILRRYFHRDIRVAVVTDNQGIPGIGDQGAGGIAICLGKLMLYTQGGGIAPWHCLPISLDVGTDNEELLTDRQYLGWRHKRLQGEEYLAFVGKFVRAFRNVFPDALCQWENFSRKNSFGIRDAFADEIISFNDDIQSTGAVALAAIISATRKKREKLSDQKFMVLGDDSSCIGICEQLYSLLAEEGMDCQEARDLIFLADKEGVVTEHRASEYYTRPFAKDPSRFPELDLEDGLPMPEFIEKAGITTYITTFEGEGCIDRNVVAALLKNSDEPVILPMHPQTDMTQDCANSIYEWSGGKALVASGRSMKGQLSEESDWRVSQAHNVLIFPGVALGVIASGAREVVPKYFTEAARAISSMVSRDELERGQLLPCLNDVEKIANRVALAVAMCCVDGGLSRPCVYSSFQHEQDESRMRELIKKMRWDPNYLPLIPM